MSRELTFVPDAACQTSEAGAWLAGIVDRLLLPGDCEQIVLHGVARLLELGEPDQFVRETLMKALWTLDANEPARAAAALKRDEAFR